MENFTPISAVLGGLLIGAAAVMLLGMLGRVAGISGIIGGVFDRRSDERSWCLAFIAGLVLAPLLYAVFNGALPVSQVSVPVPIIVIGGLLVGFGTRLGSGCTSGHGVCGIARLSRRSIAATVVFMVTAGLTVYLLRHWGGF